MVRYFTAWTPLVIVGTVVLLTLPWLGLIALMIFSLVVLGAVAAFVSVIVFVPYTFGRAVSRRWRERRGASQASAALTLAERKSA